MCAAAGAGWLHVALVSWHWALALALPTLSLLAAIVWTPVRPPIAALMVSDGRWQVRCLDGEICPLREVEVRWRSDWLAIVALRSTPGRQWRLEIWPDSLADPDRRRLYRELAALETTQNGAPTRSVRALVSAVRAAPGKFRWPN